MDLLGRQKLPQVELSEDELNALSGLGKVDQTRGVAYNPYQNINPEFLNLNDDDDDDWLYLSEEQKPRERTGHIFNMVGSAALVGGGVGILSGMRLLHRRNFLNFATLRHPIKRSELITNIVTAVREKSAQFSSFAFVISMSWAFLDKKFPVKPAEGAAFGGAAYGFMGPFWHKDIGRTLPLLRTKEKEWLEKTDRAPKFWEINNWTESKILNRYRNAQKVPFGVNLFTGVGRIGVLAATAYFITNGMEWAGQQKGILRDIKRWKW